MLSILSRLVFLLLFLLQQKAAEGGLLPQYNPYYYRRPTKLFNEHTYSISTQHPASYPKLSPVTHQVHQPILSNIHTPAQPYAVQHVSHRFPSSFSVLPSHINPNHINHNHIDAGEKFYMLNGRRLKQYQVIEDIPNDLEYPSSFLGPSPLIIDSLLAKYSTANDVASRSLVQLPHFSVRAKNGPVAIGSGGLGYIRMANGQVSLGSGSLGYISGQQRSADILDARSRAGAPPDALNFGHGSIINHVY